MNAVVAAATCWCCALLAIPRLRLRDDPAAERRLAARLGRRRRLVCAALLLTVLALHGAAPGGAHPDLVAARGRHRLCTHMSGGVPTCYRWLSTGAWMREEMSDDKA